MNFQFNNFQTKKKRAKISAVVLTKNEEENIGECLKRLQWCDEVIIIDDYSEDKTVEIAKSRGVAVYKRALAHDFASQRNFGLSRVKNDWALFIDADEIVSPSLAQEIVRHIKRGGVEGFTLKRREVFLGKEMHCADKPISDWSFGPIKLLRLAKKSAGKQTLKWEGKVHEKWMVNGKTSSLKNSILHHSFPSIDMAIKKINKYSTIQAEDFYHSGTESSISQIIFYPVGKFLKNYFYHQGFRDGMHGVIYCFLMSFHSFLVRGKLWLRQKRMG